MKKKSGFREKNRIFPDSGRIFPYFFQSKLRKFHVDSRNLNFIKICWELEEEIAFIQTYSTHTQRRCTIGYTWFTKIKFIFYKNFIYCASSKKWNCLTIKLVIWTLFNIALSLGKLNTTEPYEGPWEDSIVVDCYPCPCHIAGQWFFTYG